ncbi:hypothetical protein OG542_00675 [Streptomyces violaceus]|uniref:hypothetical protein n=1 Tax=Streptomyces violaceus TaxID=1936 RepID=UPI002E1FA684
MAHADATLAQLGVTAELARKTGVFGNFAISFSVICNLAGGMSLFGYGLDHGRPVVMPASWIVIGFMTLLVGMSLADVVSAYPTSVCRSSLHCPPYGLQPPTAPSPRSTRSA